MSGPTRPSDGALPFPPPGAGTDGGRRGRGPDTGKGRPRRGSVRSRPVLGILVAGAIASCAPGPALPPPPVAFDAVRTWIVTGADSVPITVELATSVAQAERGLMDRTSLDPDSGMLFIFAERRGPEDGFWMWRTRMPLDLAVLDEEGHIVATMGMEPCLEALAEDCPPHIPGETHSAALEVNRGWFEENGVGVGSQVRLPGR